MHFLIDIAHAAFWVCMCLIPLGIVGLIKKQSSKKKPPKSFNFIHTSERTQFTTHESMSVLKARQARAITTPAAAATDGETEGTDAETDAIGRGNCWALLRFTGDVKATGKDGYALLVSEVIENKEKFKGVICVFNSPGGGVAEYGQLYSENMRLKNAGLEVHVCSDTYLCSGGYLMSLPATKIIAADLAYVGSVGVVTEFLNFYEAAKNLGIAPQLFHSGERKRTITQLSDPTDPEKRAAFQGKLDEIYGQFVGLVRQHRPQIDPANLNGDSWTARHTFANNMGFVDEIATSAQYIARIRQENDIIELGFKKSPFEGGILKLLTHGFTTGIEAAATKVATRMLEDTH